jgi:hypothetical protein
MPAVPGKTVVHNGVECDVYKRAYANGRPALQLVERGTGEPYCAATVNLPDVAAADGEVFVKDYAENHGVLAAMVLAGVVGPSRGEVPVGFVSAHRCPLLV